VKISGNREDLGRVVPPLFRPNPRNALGSAVAPRGATAPADGSVPPAVSTPLASGAAEFDKGKGRRMGRTWPGLALVLASAAALILGISDQAAKAPRAGPSLATWATER
jgi:hypothetical protein